MKSRKQRLVLDQIDQRLKPFITLKGTQIPNEGWLFNIRKALNMSLRQLAERMKISPQAVNAYEQRERDGTISIKSLRDAANALDMELIYAFIPREGSLDEMVEHRAMQVARDIVNRTSHTMKLEDQENPKDRLMQAFVEKKNELKTEMPRFLWD